jgi:hypothetical protein
MKKTQTKGAQMGLLFKSLQIKGLFRKVQALIVAAEHLYPKLPGKGTTGPQKKEWVTKQIAGAIDIKLLSEAQEMALVGLIVDVCVDAWQDARERRSDGS